MFLIALVWLYLAVCIWQMQHNCAASAVLVSGARYGSHVPK